jgi:hypothetical protein
MTMVAIGNGEDVLFLLGFLFRFCLLHFGFGFLLRFRFGFLLYRHGIHSFVKVESLPSPLVVRFSFLRGARCGRKRTRIHFEGMVFTHEKLCQAFLIRKENIFCESARERSSRERDETSARPSTPGEARFD